MKAIIRILLFTIYFIVFSSSADESIIKLEDNSEILGVWKLYAETPRLDVEKKMVQNDWNFRDNGILTSSVFDQKLDGIKSVDVKYFIEDGAIKKQIQPGREPLETCLVVKLEDDDMILHCKYLYYFLTRKQSGTDKDIVIILNQDFSFIVPLIKYVDPNGSELYYNVGFSFVPRGNQLLFEPTSITKCGVERCLQDEETATILNQDFSFNIPVIKYVDTNDFEHYYNVDFSFTPSGTKMLFEPIKITVIQ